MKTGNLKKLASALAIAGAMFAAPQAYAAPFAIDLTTAGIASPAYTGDGKTETIDELQFTVANNTVALHFTSGTPFDVGSTFTFTDSGTILGTAFLPPGFGKDYEGFGSTWTLNGAFSLSGFGKVTGTDILGNPLLTFAFLPGGSLTLDYVDGNETVNVLTAVSTKGAGNVSAVPGADVPSASGFVFSALATDLLDGFFLTAAGGDPFIDGFTFAQADGNVDRTSTTGAGLDYLITAKTDGSASLFAVPEPGSLALFSIALMGLGGLASRKGTPRKG